MEGSEVAISTQTTSNIAVFTGNNGNEATYSSYQPQTMEEKTKWFNTLNRCTGRLNDIEGQVIKVKHIYLQQFNRRDKETGETRIGRRTIVLTEDGKSFVTMSSYFAMQLGKLLQTFGTPDTWEKPLSMKIIKVAREGLQGKILQFELV